MARATATRPSPLGADDPAWARMAYAVTQSEEVRVWYLRGILTSREAPDPLDKARGTLASYAGRAVQINSDIVSVLMDAGYYVHIPRRWVTEITFFGLPPKPPAPVTAPIARPAPPPRIPTA